MNNHKDVYIIAGPNGSGKTTFANKFLPDYAKCRNFINADLIAQGLSPFSPSNAAIKAGKLVLSQIHEFAKDGVDFAFESTLAGKLYVNLFRELKAKGYRLHLFFLWISDADLAIARIKDRVAEGGHNVPVKDIKRCFKRSIYNFFKLYRSLLDSWMFFNNDGSIPDLIAKGENGRVSVIDKKLFEGIKKSVR